MNLKKEDIEKIKVFLINRISPLLLIIFGSSVKGAFRDDSDIDIAFVSKNSLDTYEIFMIAQDLAKIVSRDVDLIDLKKASTVFQAQIVGEGEIIYSENDDVKNEFILRVLKEYAFLNEERGNILERIKREGTIYG